jgi:hypothetical protein
MARTEMCINPSLNSLSDIQKMTKDSALPTNINNKPIIAVNNVTHVDGDWALKKTVKATPTRLKCETQNNCRYLIN